MTAVLSHLVLRDRWPAGVARRAPFAHGRGDVALSEVVTALLSQPDACARWLARMDAAIREEVVS